MRALALAALALAVALSGCTSDEPADADANETDTGHDNTTRPTVTVRPAPRPGGTDLPSGGGDDATDANFTVALARLPRAVVAGEPFTINVTVEGQPPQNATIGAGAACAATRGAIPGNFTLACATNATGSFTLQANATLETANATFLSQNATITAREPVVAYRVWTSDAPARPIPPGGSFELQIHAEGAADDTADAVTARWGNRTTDIPTEAHYPYACHRAPAEVPDTIVVRCSVPQDTPPGTYFLRAFVHFDVAEGRWWWADEDVLVVG